MERGKLRYIQSLHVCDRIIQKCLGDYALVPLLKRNFIYDNSACLKGKGQHFASKRLVEFLRRHYRKHGNNGWALVFDFSKYFERIGHEAVKKLVSGKIHDCHLQRLIFQLIDDFGDEKGLGLGSQISQILALAFANHLDHTIKEKFRVKHYIRYNDDGILIHSSKDFLKRVLEAIRHCCDELGIVLNEKKTQIIKLSRGIIFLKARYYLTFTGKIIKKLPRKAYLRTVQKMKKLRVMIGRGERPPEVLSEVLISWKGYTKHFDALRVRRNMMRFYENLRSLSATG